MTTPVPREWLTEIASWRAWSQAQGSPRTTLTTRTQHLNHLARTLTVPGGPWRVTGSDLVAWAAAQEWKPETRRGRRSTLRVFYAWGVETGRTAHSAALALPRVRPTTPNPSPAPDSVYLPALAGATARERLILRLAAEHGLRRAEIAQVHSRDLLEDLTGYSLVVHGKGGRERVVPLVDDVARQLRALPPGWAFPGDDQGHLSPRWVGTLIGRLLPDGWTIHKLRHRAATAWWDASGHDLFVVQELLGHADPKTTRAYTKIAGDRLRSTVNRAA